MIALLRGRPAGRLGASIIIDVSGVGYLVTPPPNLIDSLIASEEVSLHIATIVREDDISLYGFGSPEQREAFDILRGVKGVGPRLAIGILGQLSMPALVTALTTGDTAPLLGVSGVGKRLADRLCLELKNKLPAHFKVSLTTPFKAVPADPLPLALAQLDYRKTEIDTAMTSPDVPGFDDAPIEIRLRAALRVLQKL
jgi:Holliday junction DNA helicase RuvA